MKINLKEPFSSAFLYLQEKLSPEKTYLVGGFIRDFLLHRESFDMDCCTSMRGEEIHALFPDGLYFPKYGTVSFSLDRIKVTIAALRKESQYLDHRHPTSVTFVRTIEEDFPRRDFTINALYADRNLEILDPSLRGLQDLKEKKIRFLGDPLVRIKEDPLRILRALRFSVELGFTLEEDTALAIQGNMDLIQELKREKVIEEIHKCPKEKQGELLSLFSLDSYLRV